MGHARWGHKRTGVGAMGPSLVLSSQKQTHKQSDINKHHLRVDVFAMDCLLTRALAACTEPWLVFGGVGLGVDQERTFHVAHLFLYFQVQVRP